MQVLSKYSKTKNITNVNDITQKEYLDSLATTQTQKAPDDYYNPFTFEEWYLRNTGIIVGSDQKQYSEYLKGWYNSRYTKNDVTLDLKNDYISFMKNLTMFLSKDDTTNLLVDINWDDPLEVEQVIPYCAKKLKEIAIYFVNKREAIKNTKLKYNITGANQALEKMFYEYLLKAFTKRNYVLNVNDADLYNTFPDLSSVNSGFQIYIDELYDDSSYMDKSNNLPASSYFDTTSPEVTAYYNTHGINTDDYEWLFKTGFASLCADNPLYIIMSDVISQTSAASAYVDLESNILNQYYQIKLSQKYIGADQYFVSGGYYIPWTTSIDYNLVAGNNWFYLPSGEFLDEYNTINIDNVPLISSTLINSGAIGDKNYINADKIFICCDNTVSGAWLKKTTIDSVTETMSALLINSKSTIFKFPFPGYGLSGEDLDWTGKQMSNLDNTYQYLDEQIQNVIKETYWNNTTTTSSIKTLEINDSTLIESGATADYTYDGADNITTRITDNVDKTHDTTPDEVYQGEMKHAWLYKVDKTDIPVKRGQNYIQWPLYRYDNNTETLRNLLTSQCAPTPLSSINIDSFVGSRAGYDLYDSDIIYKLDSRNGAPIECAFLSGKPLKDLLTPTNTTVTQNATGVIQNSLSLKCLPNKYTTFVWQDEDTYIDDVIKNVPHSLDCPYRFEDKFSLYTENPADNKDLNYRLWKKCECGAIQYSPIGHRGRVYDDYKGYSDIIFEDYFASQGGVNIPFNKTSWFDSNGDGYKSSTNFAWYQITGVSLEPDIGWGDGRWVVGADDVNGRFKFKKGHQYRYYRTPMGHSDTYVTDGTVPYMVVKYKYNNPNNSIWIKGIANSDGTWQNTQEITDMILNAGDFIVYDHIDSNWYCITGVGDTGVSYNYYNSAINLNNNKWINYNYVTTGVNVQLSWPDVIYSDGPSVPSYTINEVNWQVISPTTVYNYTTDPTQTVIIQPTVVGTWSVNVTGKELATDTKHLYSNVANFTVVSPTLTQGLTGSLTTETIYTDTINMSINAQLSGWNYTTNMYDGSSIGSRPFWAYASDKNDRITKYKGIDKWGGGIRIVDDYVFITQPDKSDMVLDIDSYIKYTAKNNITWIQPITFNVNITSANWCDLIIDTTKVSPLSDYLYNINTEMVVSATDKTTDLYLASKINDIPVFVNYWANSAFKWSQTYTDATMGLPPTGGVFVQTNSGLLLEPIAPYANFTNKHYPTIATVPHVEELYSISDVGGYFIPKMLGITTALEKYSTNYIDSTRIPNNLEGNNAFATFTDINTYTTDNSISKTEGNVASVNDQTDSTWMKSAITTGKKAGNIVEAARHQEFIPYKTKYETTGKNPYGVHQQSDPYDPWYGEFDSDWENNADWPSDFKKNYNISTWYSQKPPEESKVYQWKTDIFNNQYALYKPINNVTSIYEKKHNIGGEVWIRTQQSILKPASSVLPEIYDYVGTDAILDIDMFYDTLMYYTSSSLYLFKVNTDFDTGDISVEINEGNIIPLNDHKLFGGTWLHENKTVSLCYLLSSGYYIKPVIYKYDINTNRMLSLYNSDNTCFNLSSYNLTAIENPSFTFDSIKGTYNITYIAYGQDKNGMYLISDTLHSTSSGYDINNKKIIVPVD